MPARGPGNALAGVIGLRRGRGSSRHGVYCLPFTAEHSFLTTRRLAVTSPEWIMAAMSITAVIEDGVIVIPKDVPWESGTVMHIEPVAEQPPTPWETLKEFDGMAGDLPPDLAASLDHYIHGHSRQ